jgi:putative FmdB family regulatory protein
MPIYEYECRACRQRFEKLQSINDEPIRVCPNCGGETRRVLQPVGVIFKGSGWYITDSRKSTPAATSTTPGKSEKSESAGSESTPSGESSPAKDSPSTTPAASSGGED